MAKAAKTQGFLNMVGSLVTVIDKPAPTNKLTAVERMRGNFANCVFRSNVTVDSGGS